MTRRRGWNKRCRSIWRVGRQLGWEGWVITASPPSRVLCGACSQQVRALGGAWWVLTGDGHSPEWWMQIDPRGTFLPRQLSRDKPHKPSDLSPCTLRALGAGVVGTLWPRLAQVCWGNPSGPHLVSGWGRRSRPPTAVEKGGPPLASSWTAAHARSWHFRLDPGLLQGPVPAPGQLGYLLFILGRAGSWQQGLKWCLPFIFRDGKMLAFWQPLSLAHIGMASKSSSKRFQALDSWCVSS